MSAERERTIQSRGDLDRFIREDLRVRGLERLPRFYQVRKPIIHYTVMLRRVEYLVNCRPEVHYRLWRKIMQLRLKLKGAKLGFSITPNTFGPGLYLAHWGSVVISSLARVGANAKVHSCVRCASDWR
jgi:serine O-acetyltransferase